MADFNDFFDEDKNGLRLGLGATKAPVDAAIMLSHEFRGASDIRLAASQGTASYSLVDDAASAVGTFSADKSGASLGLGAGSNPSVALSGPDASIEAGLGDGRPGSMTLHGRGGRSIFANAANGRFVMRGGTGSNALFVDTNAEFGTGADTDSCDVVIGGANRFGQLSLQNSSDSTTIKLSGQTGDIEFFNADFAEEFEVASQAFDLALPGTVMSLSQAGTVEVCDEEYSTAAVGVVAGAGSYRPALVLDKNGGPNRRPIAMIGKVGCLVDANETPIQIGDLLTTSANPGHAQAVTDRSRALGAVIGKALSPLASGTGLIRVLVTLQ